MPASTRNSLTTRLLRSSFLTASQLSTSQPFRIPELIYRTDGCLVDKNRNSTKGMPIPTTAKRYGLPTTLTLRLTTASPNSMGLDTQSSRTTRYLKGKASSTQHPRLWLQLRTMLRFARDLSWLCSPMYVPAWMIRIELIIDQRGSPSQSAAFGVPSSGWASQSNVIE